MHRLIVCLALSILYGCSNVKYIEPTSGDRARVRFVTNTETAPTVLRVYSGADCTGREYEWMRLQDRALLLEPVKRLGMPLDQFRYDEHAIQEVYVSAGKPVIGILWGSRNSVPDEVFSCGVPFNITFDKNKDYEVMYVLSSNACQVRVSEIAIRKKHEIYKKQSGGHFRNNVAQFNNVHDKDSVCGNLIDRFNTEGLHELDSFKIKFN